jgi:hypothetical protein
MENNNTTTAMENSTATMQSSATVESSTPAVMDSQTLAMLQTASEVLQRNQLSVSKATEAGQQIIALINQTGMNDQVDEKCNSFMVAINKTIKAMNDRRSPITQTMTQVAKQFTSLENELKDGQTVKYIQQQRNDWAKKKAAEAKQKEEEAKRKLLIENEKVETRKKIELDLIAHVTRQITVVSDHLTAIFNNATLQHFDNEVKKVTEFPPAYTKRQYDTFAPVITAIYLTKEDLAAMTQTVKDENFEGHAKRYWETIDDLKINLEAKAPARKKELETIAETEKTNAIEAARLKAEAEARQKAEEERQKAEAAEKAKQAEQAVQASAQAATMQNLFSATEAAIVPGQGKAQVRASQKVTVTHQSAWVEIFTWYMQNEGMKLGIEELGKKSLNQMKAWCEKEATRTGEQIKSKYIRYEEDFTAVNKA